MEEKIQIKSVEMVRRIRDEQARMLAGKSKSEIIAFFRKAGEGLHQDPKNTPKAGPEFPGTGSEQSGEGA